MTPHVSPQLKERGMHRTLSRSQTWLRRIRITLVGVLTLAGFGYGGVRPAGADTPLPNSQGSIGRAWNDSWIGVYNIPGIDGNALCSDNDIHTYPTGDFSAGQDYASSGDGSAIAYLLHRYASSDDPDVQAAIDAANSKWGAHTSSTDYSIAVEHGLGDTIDAIMAEGRANAGPYVITVSGLIQHGGGGSFDITYTATVHVAAAEGGPVSGQTVTLTGSNATILNGTVVTDAAGNATFQYTIPAGINPNYSIAAHTASPVLVEYLNLNGNQPVVTYRGQDTAAAFDGGVDPHVSATIIKYAEGDTTRTPVAGATFRFTAADGTVLGTITTTDVPAPLEGFAPGATYTVTETQYSGPAGLYIPAAATIGYQITIPTTATDGFQLAFANPHIPVVTVATQANYQIVETNVPLADAVSVAGNDGEDGTINATLHGPAPVPASGQCGDITAEEWAETKIVGTYTVAVTASVNNGNGDYEIIGAAPTVAGCYGWTETITLTPSKATASSPPTSPGESTLVVAPTVRTTISQRVALPGDTLTDTITVSGTGSIPANNANTLGTVVVTLAYMPFHDTAMRCADITPGGWRTYIAAHPNMLVKTETLTVPASGTLVSGAYTIPAGAIGCYSYAETFRSALSPNATTVTEFGDVTETATVIAPTISTLMSSHSIADTDTVVDTITVSGLHGQSGVLSGVLLGPATPNPAGTCDGVMYDVTAFVATFDPIIADHDGSDYATNPVAVTPGFTACYTGYESLTIGDRTFYTPTPGEVTETVLATPPSTGTGLASAGSGAAALINTGNPGPGDIRSTTATVAGVFAILIGLLGAGLVLARRRSDSD
jgi:hypothetical protein